MKEGDSACPGDALAEIETDKASMAFESQDDLYIAKILVDQGSEVTVGGAIMVTVENEADVNAFANFTLADVPSGVQNVEVVTAPATTSAADAAAITLGATIASSSEPIRLSPAAAHIATSQRISLEGVVGTARGGRISKADLILAIKAGKAVVGGAPTPVGGAAGEAAADASSATPTDLDAFYLDSAPVNENYTDIPNSNMRKVIAKRLTESKSTVPHLYAQIECQLDDLMATRKAFTADLNTNVSVNDLVIKAAALALRDLPDVRRKWDPRVGAVTEPDGVDIAVAVATPNGLITPIVTGADRRGCADINAVVKDLAGRAKENKLMPEEYQGGSFSISNLGMFGISSFSAVINPPQACILAVGAGIPRPMPPKEGETEPSLGTFLNVQLSADRRVVDEALAAQFLELFREYLAKPKNLLM